MADKRASGATKKRKIDRREKRKSSAKEVKRELKREREKELKKEREREKELKKGMKKEEIRKEKEMKKMQRKLQASNSMLNWMWKSDKVDKFEARREELLDAYELCGLDIVQEIIGQQSHGASAPPRSMLEIQNSSGEDRKRKRKRKKKKSEQGIASGGRRASAPGQDGAPEGSGEKRVAGRSSTGTDSDGTAELDTPKMRRKTVAKGNRQTGRGTHTRTKSTDARKVRSKTGSVILDQEYGDKDYFAGEGEGQTAAPSSASPNQPAVRTQSLKALDSLPEPSPSSSARTSPRPQSVGIPVPKGHDNSKPSRRSATWSVVLPGESVDQQLLVTSDKPLIGHVRPLSPRPPGGSPRSLSPKPKPSRPPPPAPAQMQRDGEKDELHVAADEVQGEADGRGSKQLESSADADKDESCNSLEEMLKEDELLERELHDAERELRAIQRELGLDVSGETDDGDQENDKGSPTEATGAIEVCLVEPRAEEDTAGGSKEGSLVSEEDIVGVLPEGHMAEFAGEKDAVGGSAEDRLGGDTDTVVGVATNAVEIASSEKGNGSEGQGDEDHGDEGHDGDSNLGNVDGDSEVDSSSQFPSIPIFQVDKDISSETELPEALAPEEMDIDLSERSMSPSLSVGSGLYESGMLSSDDRSGESGFLSSEEMFNTSDSEIEIEFSEEGFSAYAVGDVAEVAQDEDLQFAMMAAEHYRTRQTRVDADPDMTPFTVKTQRSLDKVGSGGDESTKEEDEWNDRIGSFLGRGRMEEERMDFNGRFQTIMEQLRGFYQKPNGQLHEEVTYHRALIALASDFLFTAKAYGKIIISEVNLDESQRTIPPVDVGGVAGGSKYMAQGILFKFALDTSGIYGNNDAAAASVAGHELKGLQAYYNCNISRLCLPLMALVDYLGFRLIAITLLPIDDTTLVYGTNDGGHTMHNSDEELSELMKDAARMLNVRSHKAGCCEEEKRVLVHSAADVEGHRGTDGRYYLIDFARTFPCVQPEDSTSGINLTHLFRPEFVKSFRVPLCSDAYSGFTSREFNGDIDAASRELQWKHIPNFAGELPLLFEKAQEEELWNAESTTSFASFRLTEVIHSHGINVRYLGLLYTYLNKEKASSARDNCRALLLVELVARVIKLDLRRRFRKCMEEIKRPLEAPALVLAVNYLNLVFGGSDTSTEYWEREVKTNLVKKFTGFVLHQGSNQSFKDMTADLISNSPGVYADWRWVLLNRVQEMMGFKIRRRAQQDLTEKDHLRWSLERPLDFGDVESLGERVKFMNTVSHAHGMVELYNAIRSKAIAGKQDREETVQMLGAGIKCFQDVLTSNPYNARSLRECALALVMFEVELTELTGRDRKKKVALSTSSNVVRAFKYLERARELNDKDEQTLLSFAVLYSMIGEYEEAEEYFLRTLETAPRYINGMKRYARFLQRRGITKHATKLNHFAEFFENAMNAELTKRNKSHAVVE